MIVGDGSTLSLMMHKRVLCFLPSSLENIYSMPFIFYGDYELTIIFNNTIERYLELLPYVKIRGYMFEQQNYAPGQAPSASEEEKNS